MADALILGRSTPRAGAVTVGLCCLVTLIEGFDLQAAGVVAPRLVSIFNLTPGQLGLFFSASTMGMLIGAAFGGRFSDRFGRKKTLIVSVALFGLMSILTGLAHSFEVLLLARLLTGVGLGSALPNLIALVTESTAPGRRASAVALLYAGLPAGGALASLFTLVGAESHHWSTIFITGGVAPLLVVPLIWAWLPHSSTASAQRGGGSVRSVPTALFGEGRAATTLILWLAFVLGLLVLYLLLNWLPSLVIARGMSRADASWVQFVFNLGSALGSTATGLLMDRWGKVTTAALVFSASVAALILIALVPSDLSALVFAGFFLGVALAGTQAVLYALAPSCYPTDVLGTGVGAAVSMGRFGSVLGPMLAGTLVGAGRSDVEVLVALIPILMVSGGAATILSLRIRSA
ncbi:MULTISPECIES: 3-(3-hydroxy-phenyl)propionate transporter MhpT [Methylorubrum]|uniref:3-(3-hydroxy-phenyl)propionate transporter MhpT n=1 Tax=Methylorubrum TaxID=2282523 RepID=UPI00209DC11A|nr:MULTISPECIES: 3-(3-hydroxy-phenyl)propionate transporter MhpT [Methylorubrum]MCJ2032111.1 3-(3-hydroxy-phenyl)propionate transporter MhpT [Methylobacterium sp. J-043]MDF9861055.1 AAHS family 3-hydroxyphenylpropionic acid transporter [Methylorubrum pseudosasae]MDH6640111.1 AAHS family 3-hydroxyphenylpropionic acid transporter [Methylobacterium sp. SuP10 SLI 274]MCP1551565.1 AAHS family 3-hydroxyphenylpropionic acid transporter [Methylorubrum zatmanii]MCP1556502.1 AAHS family 3-hydroxyphenylp